MDWPPYAAQHTILPSRSHEHRFIYRTAQTFHTLFHTSFRVGKRDTSQHAQQLTQQLAPHPSRRARYEHVDVVITRLDMRGACLIGVEGRLQTGHGTAFALA